MALYCPKYNLLYLANPRSGSTATIRHLQRHYGGYQIPETDLPATDEHPKVRGKHGNLADLEARGLIPSPRPYTFATLRDPREICLTWYYYHRAVGEKTLADPESPVHTRKHRAEHMRIALTSDFTTWTEKVVGSGVYQPDNFSRCAYGVDTVLRHERLEEDFAAMLHRLDLPVYTGIKRENVTPGKQGTWQDHYTPRARKIVEGVYAEHMAWWRGLSD